MENTMSLDLNQVVHDLSVAFKSVDAAAPQGSSKTRTYRPGIGPLTEAEAIKQALVHLQSVDAATYFSASPKPYPGTRQFCDMVIPHEWAIELKLIRPFGDNGVEAEHRSENILHPYPGNVSAISDCIKLMNSAFDERKAIIVFGYGHAPPVIKLEVAVNAFEAIARHVVGPEYGFSLGPRRCEEFSELIHPYH
jgi:hypothetical protein